MRAAVLQTGDAGEFELPARHKSVSRRLPFASRIVVQHGLPTLPLSVEVARLSLKQGELERYQQRQPIFGRDAAMQRPVGATRRPFHLNKEQTPPLKQCSMNVGIPGDA